MEKNDTAKVAWAFDPFSKPTADLTPWARFLDYIAKIEDSTVEPVYVLSPDGLNWSGEFSGPWVKKYKPLAETAAETVLAEYYDETIMPVRILVNQKASLRGDVKKLALDAEKQHRSLIVVQTHARKGLDRFLLGSFAESLLMFSKVPVLCVNPHTTPPDSIRRILFPTDLSGNSKSAFVKLVNRCKRWGAQLVIAHKLPDPIEPIVQSGVYMAGGGWITLSQYFEKESTERKQQLQVWQEEALAAGVQASIEIIDQPGLVGDAVLQMAENSDIDVIALCSQSGPVSSIITGSVARQIVRRAHCPVLVFHETTKH